MYMLERKNVPIFTLLVLLLSTTGCSNRFTTPDVNPNPNDKIVLTVHSRAADGEGKLTLKGVQVYYTTTAPGCGYMNYFKAIGGLYERPKARITFSAHGDSVVVYRDYFIHRKVCPFKVDQAIIRLVDMKGSYVYANANGLISKDEPPAWFQSVCELLGHPRYYICSKRAPNSTAWLPKRYDFIVTVSRAEARR